MSADTRPPARDRILDAARHLFQRHGFSGVGVSDILMLADAPKGSLYHHFPGGKDDLAAVAVAGIAADVTAFIEARATGGETGAAIVGAVAAMCAHRMAQERFAWSPLISTMAAQADPEHPRLAAALHAAYGAWHTALETAFRREDLDREQAAAAARLSLLTLEGAITLARAQRDGAPLALVGPLVSQFVAGRRG